MAAQIKWTHCCICNTKLCQDRYARGCPHCQTCQDKEDAAEAKRIEAVTYTGPEHRRVFEPITGGE